MWDILDHIFQGKSKVPKCSKPGTKPAKIGSVAHMLNVPLFGEYIKSFYLSEVLVGRLTTKRMSEELLLLKGERRLQKHVLRNMKELNMLDLGELQEAWEKPSTTSRSKSFLATRRESSGRRSGS